MDIREWDERYRLQANDSSIPTKLLVETASRLQKGKALDLACGTGRNALWLADHGWEVTAIDGSATAINILRKSASDRLLSLTTEVADLQDPNFYLPQRAWHFAAVCYYLQRDLIPQVKNAVVSGGTVLTIVHITEGDEQPTASRLRPGELKTFFADWDIVHLYEGKPDDPAHKRSVAEVVARRPD